MYIHCKVTVKPKFLMATKHSIMFLGTGSGVGKSIITAAFCRYLCRNGFKAAPFKAQNMALNSAVTPDGLEMGRAQIYQAEACGLEPDVRMNPILLKPSSDSKSQVIVMGRPMDTANAADYYTRYEWHRKIVQDAFDSLASEYDIIVMEGAGSPAEINLQKTDIVNMAMAAYADAPAVIIGDIDRGGVFAWLKGTVDLLPDRWKSLTKGFIINKFRGDIALLEPGIKQFRQIIDIPTLGVLPWFDNIEPDQEDGVFVNSVASSNGKSVCRTEEMLHVKVIRLPRISNFTDFAPFSIEPDIMLEFVTTPLMADECDCIIIPGTKATVADMEFLNRTGWTKWLKEKKGKIVIVGICGGYQMLGETIHDPLGIEGDADSIKGLGLLPLQTEMRSNKTVTRTRILLDMPPVTDTPMEVHGYEIHMGATAYSSETANTVSSRVGADFGAMTEDGIVWGMYLHGIFDNDNFRTCFANFLRRRRGLQERPVSASYMQHRAEQLDRMADWIEAGIDMDALMHIIGI